MIALSYPQVEKISKIVTVEQFNKPAHLKAFHSMATHIMQDYARNIYFHLPNDRVIYLGHVIRQNDKIFFIDKRDYYSMFPID